VRLLSMMLFFVLLLQACEMNVAFKYLSHGDDSIMVVGYDGFHDDVEIPETIDGYTVEAILLSTFRSSDSLHIPKTVTHAFTFNMDELYDYEPSDVELPLIDTITVDDDNPSLFVEDGILYADEGETLLMSTYSKDSLEFTLPETVRHITPFAFYPHRGSLNVTFSEESALQTIGIYAFAHKAMDGDLDLPDGLMTIGEGAFKSTLLDSVHVPDSVRNIGQKAFMDIQTEDGLTATIDASIQTLRTSMFESSNLASIDLSDTIRIIRGHAFKDSGLDAFTFHEGITTIGEHAFRGTELGNVTFPSTISTIDAYAFSNSGLTRIEFHEDAPIDAVRFDVFSHNDALEYVYLPRTIQSIASRAFAHNNALHTVILPRDDEDSPTSVASASNPENLPFYRTSNAVPLQIVVPDAMMEVYLDDQATINLIGDYLTTMSDYEED